MCERERERARVETSSQRNGPLRVESPFVVFDAKTEGKDERLRDLIFVRMAMFSARGLRRFYCARNIWSSKSFLVSY